MVSVTLIQRTVLACLAVAVSVSGQPTLTITTSFLPTGTVGQTYISQLQTNFGAGSYLAWSILQGNLPPGLSLSATGEITGKATSAGMFTFTLQVIYSEYLLMVQKQLSIGVNSNCQMGPPTIATVTSASDYGGFSTFAPGSWLEVKGSNLALHTRQWAGTDFLGTNAPTSLDGSQVSIDGNLGYPAYISNGQINVQAPADTKTGPVQITVSNCAGTSAPFTLQEAPISPGLLSPLGFNIGGKQYIVATLLDGVTLVGFVRPAKPGDTIVAYGVGFGPVSPAIAPGEVVTQANSIPGLTVSFTSTTPTPATSTPAATTYAGLIGGYVGLYEFYITVPNVPDDDYQIEFSIGGTPVLQQKLYLTVQQ
jgi:uncharacterized protein (TIGR03437 family)